jgi:hypothetical protein
MWAMASMKKHITFNEYWKALKDEARDRGWSIGEFMQRCNVPRQRYSEFDKGKSLTGAYMNKLMEGTGLTQKNLEERSGKRFSEEQIKERRIESWAAAHRDIIEAMVDDPDLVPIVRSICTKRAK